MSLDANGNLTDLADTGYTLQDLQNFFTKLSQETGASVEADDVDKLRAKLMGEAGFIRQLGGNPQGAFDAFREQYARRGGAPTGVSSVATQGSAKPPDPAYAAAQILKANPPAIAGNVVTMGPAAAAPSGTSTGPTGLLAAPNTYSTGSVPTPYGPTAGGGLNMTTLLLLAVAGAAAFYFLRK